MPSKILGLENGFLPMFSPLVFFIHRKKVKKNICITFLKEVLNEAKHFVEPYFPFAFFVVFKSKIEKSRKSGMLSKCLQFVTL